MTNLLTLSEIKNEVRTVIRQNKERGFLPYSGCNRVCHALIDMLENSRLLEDRKLSFDIHLFIFVEILKLVSHADTSSGAATDAIHYCLSGVEELSRSATLENRSHMLGGIIKTSKNKACIEWAEHGYGLLSNAVYLVRDHKDAESVYSIFPMLGTMYGRREYPDRFVITQGIIERLNGVAAADQYVMEHLDVPEMRKIMVERAIGNQQYSLAEQLCVEALQEDKGNYHRPPVWAYHLERIYSELRITEKQVEMIRLILLRGDTSYFQKLKELCQLEGTWEETRGVLLHELLENLMPHDFAALLSQEGETAKLLEVVRAHPIYVEHYGKQLAQDYPEEAYSIYEEYIFSEAAAATDRRKYKGVCRLIKSYFRAGAKEQAKGIIRQLIENYPRRVAMVDELQALSNSLQK
ncbi:hypothetical protein [Paenibacillus hamazuiensis]|uniref:hypothetical protein n=1 Tax=Paenibacillus hamazuiensis TaxID=2936508 RepID=UPI00200BB082|nr:hypothetical protein [Paenibacillus hamazuiensis]